MRDESKTVNVRLNLARTLWGNVKLVAILQRSSANDIASTALSQFVDNVLREAHKEIEERDSNVRENERNVR
jgi:hypothetical protein